MPGKAVRRGVFLRCSATGRILVYFSVIVLIVGYEVGLLTTIPKYLTERCAIPLDEGGPVRRQPLFCRPDNRNVRRNDHPGKSGPAAILAMTMCFAVAGYALLLLTGCLGLSILHCS